MAGRKEIKLEPLHLASRQYFSRVGVLTQQSGSLKFAEIKFDPADTALTDFLTSGIRLNDNSTLLPHRELESQIKSLKQHRDILDIGILPEPTTVTYMCTDYAVLDVISKTKKFKSLTHLIPWGEKEKYGFYAVWIQMPHYYRYCYEGGHNCGIYGHMATSCIRDKPSKHALEQLETGDIAQSSVDSDPTLPKSTKLKFLTMRLFCTIHRTGPKRSRMYAAQKPYERPVARSQSIIPKEPIYISSVSMQVGQTDTIITDSPMHSFSSVTRADEGPTTPMLQ
ncbi:hypothetical protein G6F46_009501 [Rhizopus delemar]|nr:hypothetical protein G6F55_008418 [Rhizopus delemar]KAG1538688.1 hypothetical protein G6F51_009615 [Rhizopus arrhizus]KAG1492934.1 hypothetical protein G6F54_008946 [Rhizopus delemar]KAG1506976.1 hypothetical protein G6F53_009295 [Rhizopus delemar]KAG1519404.1 hypothetical protein G6F52_008654 [Rhizopus delemar]